MQTLYIILLSQNTEYAKQVEVLNVGLMVLWLQWDGSLAAPGALLVINQATTT